MPCNARDKDRDELIMMKKTMKRQYIPLAHSQKGKDMRNSKKENDKNRKRILLAI